jgi:hypothetical protein
MTEDELLCHTIEDLRRKLRGKKTLMMVFAPIILGLLYFLIYDIIKGKDLDLPIVIIVITSIGGLVSLFPELNAIQKEIKRRSEQNDSSK